MSLVIVGAGQLYTEQPQKAAIVFFIVLFGAMIFGELWLVVWLPVAVYAAYDGYKGAEQFNEALHKKTIEALQHADATARLEAKTFAVQDFIEQIDKSHQLSKSALLTDEEFSARKTSTISMLTTKKPRETVDDFLMALIPLIRAGALTAEETQKIKTLVL